MIVVLSGGTGGAKFVDGLRRVVPAEDLTIIVNTGDDHDWWGLHVSPDIDSILYMLAGIVSAERGWGVSGDTLHCLQTMTALYHANGGRPFSAAELSQRTPLEDAMTLYDLRVVSLGIAASTCSKTSSSIIARICAVTVSPNRTSSRSL